MSNESQARGIIDQQAPAWGVTEWVQLPAGKTSLDITDFKGKVIYLYCFQSWCPGCHRRGFPTLQEVLKNFEKDPEVVFVAVQTSFEGHQVNTFERAKEVAAQYNLKIPVGQSGSLGKKSTLMQQYRTGGTPWTIIIDKQGVVRYNDFHIASEEAMTLMNKLKTEKSVF